MPLTIVKPKNSLLTIQAEGQLLSDMIEHIKTAFPNYTQLKNDVEFIEYILQIILNSSKNKVKIDIAALTVKILSSFFQYLPDELIGLQKQIDYLINNNIIQKIPLLNSAFKGVKNYVLKKVIGV